MVEPVCPTATLAEVEAARESGEEKARRVEIE